MLLPSPFNLSLYLGILGDAKYFAGLISQYLWALKYPVQAWHTCLIKEQAILLEGICL
jgi:hypothetical protein